MDQVNRCERCGRKRPCDACFQREALANVDRLVDEMHRERQTLLVWFDCAEPEQALNRLWAEWPFQLEIIWPLEPGDKLGVRLACYASDLCRNPVEFSLTDTRLTRCEDWWELAAMSDWSKSG